MVIERSGALTSNRAARRSRSLTSTLGLGEKLFASSDEKRFATAVEQGLEAVEAGLIDQTPRVVTCSKPGANVSAPP